MPPRTQTEFMDYVNINYETGCWLWNRSIDRKTGYARVGQHGYGHRLAYELFIGPIPEGSDLDHRKGCPKHCVNPYTLRPVDKDLNQRLIARRRWGQMPRKELRVARAIHKMVGEKLRSLV